MNLLQQPDTDKHHFAKRVSLLGLSGNIVLAAIKIVAGITGRSYALLADGIESTFDVFSSLVVYAGITIASRPPDRNHPHGHGKAETLAGLLAAIGLLIAASIIAIQSLKEISNPGDVPKNYTLVVLIVVVVIKEGLFRYTMAAGKKTGSAALSADAWHHRSDAFTSLMALLGIAVARYGGPQYAYADGLAALLACTVIYWNGIRLAWLCGRELMDTRVHESVEQLVREQAEQVTGVAEIEKCLVRKSGFYHLIDIHVLVKASLSVAEGHDIAHRVKDRLLACKTLAVQDVLVHIEPFYSESESDDSEAGFVAVD